jgi:hypothetical protein
MAAMHDAQGDQSNYWTPKTIDAAATNAGVPLYNYQPKSVPGQYAKTIGEFAPMAVNPSGGALPALGKFITGGVLPAVASETAGQFTKGTGFEGPARIAGAVLGGAGGTLLDTGAAAAGEMTSGAPDIAAAQAAQRAGVAMPQVALSTKPAMKGVAMGLNSVPFVGTPIRQASDTALSQIGEASSEAAKIPTGGTAVAPAEAGQSMRQGLEDYIGPTTEARIGKMYDNVDTKVNPNIITPLSETQKVVADIAARRTAASLPGNGKAVEHVLDAVQRPGGLTYNGTKTLRTSVREMLKPGRLPADMSGAELKQIYGALTKDLRQSVANAGGSAATAAFERANKYAGLVAERRKQLDKLLGTDKSNEGIVGTIQRLSGTNSAANIALLRAARKAVSPQEWNDLTSAVIGKLGLNREGKFSGDIFVSDYGKISPEAKNILFSSTGVTSTNALGATQSLRQSLDDIARLSNKMKQLQKFGNPSGTAQNLAAAGGIGAGLGSIATGIMTGSIIEPISALSVLVGGRAIADYLAQPATAEKIAKWMKVYAVSAAHPSFGRATILASATRNLASALQGSSLSSQNVRPIFVPKRPIVPSHRPSTAPVDNIARAPEKRDDPFYRSFSSGGLLSGKKQAFCVWRPCRSRSLRLASAVTTIPV